MSATAARARGTLVPIAEIRAQFPALDRTHNGHPVAYMDGPGGTQVPRCVVGSMDDYLFHHNANTHWNYPTSAETDALILDARQAIADFLGGSPDEVAFGANMTTLTFHLARALARGWSAGDEVVVTELDHHANVAPWQAIAQDRGIRVVTARMKPDEGVLDLDDLAARIGPRTRLVAIGAASNALGTVSDVRRAADLAHRVGALVFVDAVHYAPHTLVDVAALDCDFLACSAYKFYGPHIGILWGRRALLDALDAPKLAPAPDTSPEKLETGTQNHEGIVGAAAAVDFLASLSTSGGDRRTRLRDAFHGLHERGEALLRQLWSGLEAIPGVTLHGCRPGMKRTPTVAFTLAGRSPDDIAGILATEGLFCSHGDFYAATVIERLGVGDAGVVRVGCSAYTTEDEIARVVDAVRRIAP